MWLLAQSSRLLSQSQRTVRRLSSNLERGRKTIQLNKMHFNFPRIKLRILSDPAICIPAMEHCGDDSDKLRSLSVHTRWLEFPELVSELIDCSKICCPQDFSLVQSDSSSGSWSTPREGSLRLFSKPVNEHVVS